ncbi:MAG: LysE family translocator [Rubrivivax sp.]
MLEPALWQGLPLLVLAVLVLNATPGVDLLLTVSRTAQSGARAGSMAALGISTGVALHVLAAAFGLSALLAASSQAFVLIKWLGAAYLLWLGIGMLRSAWLAPSASATVPPVTRTLAPRPAVRSEVSAWVDFRRGLLTNLLNPKVALFMLAFLPQFVPAQVAHKAAAFVALGAVAVAQGLLFLLCVVAITRRVSQAPQVARFGRVLKAACGVTFLALAARLASARLAAQ